MKVATIHDPPSWQICLCKMASLSGPIQHLDSIPWLAARVSEYAAYTGTHRYGFWFTLRGRRVFNLLSTGRFTESMSRFDSASNVVLAISHTFGEYETRRRVGVAADAVL